MGGILRLKISLLTLGYLFIGVAIPLILQQIPAMGQNSALFLLCCGIMMFGFFVLGYFTIIPHLVTNLGRLSEITAKINQGDLSANKNMLKPSVFTDEVDLLSDRITQMITQLRELVTHLQSASSALDGNTRNLNENTQAVDAFAAEVGDSMAKITAGTQLQCQLALEASNLIINIAAGIEHTTRSAEDAAIASQETFGAANSGSETAKLAIDKIRVGFEKLEASSAQVYNLTTRMDEIGKIIEIITKVANQTNMLALNATIEAARAGEYGRGFTVVAEEVRKLAENVSSSADQIAELINQFKIQATGTAAAIRESTAELSASRQDMNSILSSLENIQITAQKGVDMVTDISQVTKGQLEGAKEMVEAISHIADLATDNDRSTAMFTATAQQHITSVKELTKATEELTRLSSDIQQVTDRFKL